MVRANIHTSKHTAAEILIKIKQGKIALLNSKKESLTGYTNPEEKTALISFLISSMPLSSIYVSADYNTNVVYTLCSGDQKIGTILEFMNNEFCWNGCTFSQLPLQQQRRISATIITFHILEDIQDFNLAHLL